MNLKRLLTSSFIVLVLAASSGAAACDISCLFTIGCVDCQTVRLKTGDCAAAHMKMSGNGMAGMVKTPDSTTTRFEQSAISSTFHAEMHDALVGETGPCDRQCRSEYVADVSKSTRHDAPKFRTALAVVKLPLTARFQTPSNDSRNGIVPHGPADRVPLLITLRI